MEKKIMDLKDPKLKKMVDKIVKNAKDSNLIKSLSEAFRKVPTAKEIHKGKLSSFH